MAKEKKPLSRVASTIKKGALTAQAARSGETPAEFCRSTGGKDTRTKRRCNLMKTFGKYRPGKRRGRR